MRKMYSYQKIISIVLLFSLIQFISLPSIYAADNQTDYEANKTMVNQVQLTDPSLPTSVPNQKGTIGAIISKIFDSDGRLGNWYLKLLGTRSDNAVLVWSGGLDGQLVQGSITDNGSSVGIGTAPGSSSLTVSGDIDFSGELKQNGTTIDFAGKFQDGVTTGEIYYNSGNVGIGLTDPAYTFDVSGTLNATNLRGNGSQITSLNASNITTGTINTARLPNDVVKTTGNQTIAGTKTFSSTIGGSITGNAGTATILQNARTIAGVSFDGSSNIAIPFANISSKPTTISGYGITDAVTTTGNQSISGIKTFVSNIIGNITGNASTATTLQTARNIAVSGDITGSASFNGSANISITSTIANDAVTSGKILDNTITENDISDSFVARDSNLLDGIDSTDFARLGSPNTFTEKLTISNSAYQNHLELSRGAFTWNLTPSTDGSIDIIQSSGGGFNRLDVPGLSSTARITSGGQNVFQWQDSGDNILDNTIDSSEIQNGTITGTDIANGTVTSTDISDNTITENDISDSFVARDSNLLDGIDSTAFVRTTGNQTIAGTKTFSSPIIVNDTFNINGSTPSSQQNGLYVADLGATSGTTNNPTYTAAIVGQISGARSIALSVDGGGYIYGYRGHSGAGTYTFQSKSRFADALTTARNIAVSGDITGSASFNGSSNISIASTIANDAITSAKIVNGTISAADLANNSVASAEIVNGTIVNADINNSAAIAGTKISPNFGSQTVQTSANMIAAEPTAANHLTTKNYVDTLVTQGVTWKGPVPSGSTIVGTWGACDAAKQSWTTYNKNDDIIYICDGSAWISIGSSASVPYATVSSAGKIQLAGDIGGTWNNITINNDAITSAKIAANTIVAADIAANAVGNSELASNAVQSVNIANGTIVNADIANGTITGGKIANNTIGSAQLSDDVVVSGLGINAGVGNGIRFWNSDTYKISMGNTAEYRYGPVTDYSIKSNMGSSAARGWTWGQNGVTPIAALNTQGNMQIAGSFTAGSMNVGTLSAGGVSYGSYSGAPISGLVNGSTFGGLIQGPTNAQLVVGIQDNDVNDSFSIVSGGGNYMTDGTYDTLVANFDANGNVTLGGNLTISGTMNGDSITDNTIDSSEIQNGTITGADILNNTIDEAEISDSFVARNSNLLDGIDSTSFLRSDIDDSILGKIVVGNTANRRAGMYGIYDSTKIGHIWSMGTAYQIPQDGSDFGNLYGLAYKHTNNPTGGNMASGHQMVWTQNGVPNAAIGTNIWTSGVFIGNGASITNISGDNIQNGTIDSSEIQDGTITGTDLANGTIMNVDVNAAAAIAGSKINPDFGTQTLTAGTLNLSAGASNRINFIDSDNDDFIIHQNSNRLYFMNDNNDNGTWDDGEDDRITMMGQTNGVYMGIGTSTPISTLDIRGITTTEKLDITGTTDVSLSSTNNPINIGPSTGVNMAFDGNEIQGRNNGAASSLNLNILGGGVTLNDVAGARLRVGSSNVGGNYGSVVVDGTGKGGWDGYSIENGAVFMYNGTAMGLYNDVSNEWMFYGISDGESRMYHNGVWRWRTHANGVQMNGGTQIDNVTCIGNCF